MTISNVITSAGPSITQEEIDLVTEAVTMGWHDKRNYHLDQFTEEFAHYIDRKYVLPTSHCTGAIHLAMLTLGIGPGDEVIVPDITWVASAAPIVYVGATPVFVDIEESSWCLCPRAFEAAITENTKAVVVVDLFGNMPNMGEILRIAQTHNIQVIEDAAEGLGATYKGRPSGSFGEVSLFSFSPTKLITAGQGGVFATDDFDLFEKAKYFAHHGIYKKPGEPYYWSHCLGYNYNWTNMQAALALAQFRRIDALIQKKHDVFHGYKQHLSSLKGCFLNQQLIDVKPTYWISVAIMSEQYGLNKEQYCDEFLKRSIDMRPFFYPLSSMPPYQEYADEGIRERNVVSYHLSQYGLCLPSGNNLTDSDIVEVCQALHEVVGVDCVKQC